MEASRGAAMGGSVSANITINVKAETDRPSALAEELAGPLLAILTQKLHLANLNNQGTGGGSFDAPHATGTGAP